MLTGSEQEQLSDAPLPIAPAQDAPQPLRSPPTAQRQASDSALSTPAWFGLTLLPIGAAIALANIGAPLAMVGVIGYAGIILFAIATVVAAWRAVSGTFAFIFTLLGGPEPAQTITEVAGNYFMTGVGLYMAYVATMGFSRGRQLRRLGRVLLPELRSNGDWTLPSAGIARPEQAPVGLADRWRENGKTEHASVAAFARLTLNLMALGAPPRLIAAANQDALDEIRHTELCFGLAAALDGKRISPGPFPEAQRVATLPSSRRLALSILAVDSLVDGALHEGVSARIIAKLARRCEGPAIRGVLSEIAADEGRHSAHGWAVVDWCLLEGGSGVAQALRGALRALPHKMRSDLPPAARDGAWEHWGIHGERLEDEAYQAGRAHVVERLRCRLSKYSRHAA
jgi:hypothetical protein